jgi:L-lactate dehydrogenase complex protein LldG
MQESTTREKVLKRIRKALIHRTKNPWPDLDLDRSVYPPLPDTPEIVFADRFTKAGGKFLYCANELEFIENILALAEEKKWKHIFCFEPEIQQHLDRCEFPYLKEENKLKEINAGVTLCECLAARTGTVFVSSRLASGRRTGVYAPVHIVLAYTSQIVPDIRDAIQFIKSKYGDTIPSLITAITGPSRTADIEKTLVTGAHGPKEIYLFLIDNK